MKTTVSSFADLVAEEYGPSTAQKFKNRFTDVNQEISFRQAMDVLDNDVLNLKKATAPPMPRFGPTSPVVQHGTLIMED